MKAFACLLVVGLIGCKGKSKDEGAKPAPPPPASGSGSGAAAAPPDAAPAPAPDERCASPCRFLADTPLADIAAKVKSACSAEWPAATNDCAELDYQRNCIFATAGYTFKKKRYQAAFGGESWYKARADFKDSDLSATATANVAALKQRAAECRKGTKIDDKDRKVVDAWLAKLRAGKPEIPAVIFDGAIGDATTADEMKKRLIASKADFAAKKLKSMTYRDRANMRDEWASRSRARRCGSSSSTSPTVVATAAKTSAATVCG